LFIDIGISDVFGNSSSTTISEDAEDSSSSASSSRIDLFIDEK